MSNILDELNRLYGELGAGRRWSNDDCLALLDKCREMKAALEFVLDELGMVPRSSHSGVSMMINEAVVRARRALGKE